MAKTKNDGNGKLQDALATLVQNQAALVQTQAAFVQNQATFLARMAETDRINSERFARIEAILMDHTQILAELTRIIHALPEAVREKFGFKSASSVPTP